MHGATATTLALLLAACASSSHRAPVEERATSPSSSASAATPSVLVAQPADPVPGSENAGKPGYYTVRAGDTMIRIGLESGQNWRDIVRWNNLDNPNVIEVGQVLRVVPPGTDPLLANARAVVPPKVETRSLEAKPLPNASAASAPATPSAPPPIVQSAATQIVAVPPAAREPEDDLHWVWPAAGAVLAPFEDGRSKGLVIAGKAGDPVYAVADGRVVYAGSGLRGYGNLVIVKHNATYLTAYAHNQTLLVKEDQSVRRGQKIAEMGSTDAERVELHFEVRKQGKPIDPMRVLPPR
jgi:lipoprotein NlpD